jgi:hypothetical protein
MCATAGAYGIVDERCDVQLPKSRRDGKRQIEKCVIATAVKFVPAKTAATEMNVCIVRKYEEKEGKTRKQLGRETDKKFIYKRALTTMQPA